LPSFSNIYGTSALSSLFTNVLNFIQAFNARYASINVQIVSFSPARVYDSGAPVPYVYQANSDLLLLPQEVKTRGMTLTLGISQFDGVTTQLSSIGELNTQCAAAGLQQFTTYITDSQDTWWHSVPTGLAGGFKQLTLQAVSNGVNTVAVAGGPNYTSTNQLIGGFGLHPVPGVTQVGMPEIYDIAYGGCDFPPPLCQWSVPPNYVTQTNCTVPQVTPEYINTGISNLFNTPCGDVKPMDFLNANTPSFQTWPGFAIEVSTNCFPNAASLTISGWAQQGCNSLFTFTVDQFAYFAQQFGKATAAGREANGVITDPEVPMMLYEAAFIPIAWMAQLGAPYVGNGS
jgi:hypothetical protein